MSYGVTVPMLRRMADLRRAGLGHAAIAAVISLDYGVYIPKATVSYYLRRHGGNPDPGRPSGLGLAKPGSGHPANFAALSERVSA